MRDPRASTTGDMKTMFSADGPPPTSQHLDVDRGMASDPATSCLAGRVDVVDVLPSGTPPKLIHIQPKPTCSRLETLAEHDDSTHTQHPEITVWSPATVETRGFCQGLSIIRLGVPRPIKGHFRLACFGLPSRNGIGQRGWGADQLDLLARKSVANIGLRVAFERGCHRMVVAKHIWMVASEYRTSRPFRRTVLGGPQKRRRFHHRRLGVRQTHVGMVCQRSSRRHAQYDLGGSDRDLVRSTYHPVRDAAAASPRLTMAHRLAVDGRRSSCSGCAAQLVLTRESSHHSGWFATEFSMLQQPSQNGGDDHSV